MSGAFEALGEPTRRVILEVLTGGERPVGEIVAEVQTRSPMSQPAVSQHLKVLHDARLVRVRAEGTRRIYAIDPDGLAAPRAWLTHLVDPTATFDQPLDALGTEVARGRNARERRDDQNRPGVGGKGTGYCRPA